MDHDPNRTNLSTVDGPADDASPVTLRGIGVSAGIAVGPALLYARRMVEAPVPASTGLPSSQVDPAVERERMHAAIAAAAAELRALAERVSREIGEAEAGIFAAQALMLEDPSIAEGAEARIEREGADAATALRLSAEEQAEALAAMPDPIWQGRAEDVRDAARQALAHLQPETAEPGLAQVLAKVAEPVVAVAEDLAPSDTAQMPAGRVQAIVLAKGSVTSHAAILARALSIPAVAGLGASLWQAVQKGDMLVVNGGEGTVLVRPDKQQLATARAATAELQRASAAAYVSRDQPGRTRDGHAVPLWANVGGEAEARAAAEAGAEGIGLLRTEFLFAQSASLPDARQQANLYTAIVAAFGTTHGPIVVRTLDAGADKPLPALAAVTRQVDGGGETNPALGLRGIRLQAAVSTLLATQLRALVIAAARTGADLRVMLPMVATVEEVRVARTELQAARTALEAEGLRLQRAVPLGIMVETPAAVFAVDALAQEAAFFSLGTNDLAQYVMAADRLNPRLADLCRPTQPAVLRAIHSAAHSARAAHRHVGVCGEMAAEPRLALLLVGLGVESLSMAPASIPVVKAALAAHTLDELQALAKQILRRATAGEVEQALSESLG
jgi:phosphoenolpyruvate-protein phosphotransferase